MTDRERLIELLKQANTLYLDYLESIDQNGLIDTEGRAKYIADHLIANGVIVSPVKVGTKVWLLKKDRVPDDDYRMSFHDEWVICEVNFQLSMINQIGKTVFLTREEVEKALKERCK